MKWFPMAGLFIKQRKDNCDMYQISSEEKLIREFDNI